jgi:hypothetical protein
VSSSFPPPPPFATQTRLRPWYLVAAMVLTWFVGVQGLTNGCSTSVFLRHGNVVDVETVIQKAKDPQNAVQYGMLVSQAARMKALSDHRNVAFPLSVAKILLSGLLIVASGLAMSGRRGARSLALQALVANAMLASLEFMLTRGVRIASIDAVARAAELVPESRALLRALFGMWAHRVLFGTLQLGTLAVGALALLSSRTRVFFEAVARATESAEEEP